MNDLCPHCGARRRAYWHELSPVLVSALLKFYQAIYYYRKNELHIRDELKRPGSPFTLTDDEWTNFTKLRFHALVAKARNKNGSHKHGYWVMTMRGAKFLKGKAWVPRKVQTYRNRVVGHSEDLVSISNFRHLTGALETQPQYDIVHGQPEPVEAPEKKQGALALSSS